MNKSHDHYQFYLDTALAINIPANYQELRDNYLWENVCTEEDKKLLGEKSALYHLIAGTTSLDANFPALKEMAKRHNGVLGFKFYYPELITREDYALFQKTRKRF